jgi:hypothetical protein
MAQGVEELADADELEVYYGPDKVGDGDDAEKSAEPVITFATFGAGGDSVSSPLHCCSLILKFLVYKSAPFCKGFTYSTFTAFLLGLWIEV